MSFEYFGLALNMERIPTLQVHNIVTTRNAYEKDEAMNFMCL